MRDRIRVLISFLDQVQAQPASYNDKPAGVVLSWVSKQVFGDDSDELEVLYFVRQMIDDIETAVANMPIEEEHKEVYLLVPRNIKQFFSIDHLVKNWSSMRGQISSPHNRSQLILLDALFINFPTDIVHTIDREAVFLEVRELQDVITKSNLNARVKKLLLFQMDAIQKTLENEGIFHERDFWDRYQRLSSQLAVVWHDFSEEDKPLVRERIMRMFARVRRGVTFGSEVAQIADAAGNLPEIPFFGG